MRPVPTELAAHLAGEVTTTCRCWRIVRADDAVFGFTDHDRDLTFASTTFTPAQGLATSEMTAGSGMAVGGHDVAGAFALDGLDEDDLAAGLWDNAAVTVWLVNWQDTGERLEIARGNLGEVTREDDAFRVEIRSPGHQLDQTQGRMFSRFCDADLGGGRCGVDLDVAAYTASGEVSDTDGHRRITASGIHTFKDGWFTHGLLTWISGENAGASVEVKAHTRGTRVTLSFWQATARPIADGDAFTIRAGCDKLFSTCVDKFDNAVRFRGFPHMPGNDFVLSYPDVDDDSDGEALV